MKEIVVISGKGGTGKTSLMASFALLSSKAVLADCDVDAADLHILLSPTVRERHDFRSGVEAEIDANRCNACGACLNLCRFGAIKETKGVFRVDPASCEGCGVCARFCPHSAVNLKNRLCGVWMVSDTRAGPMVHARLGIAAENSGKLVSTVRQEARRIAGETNREMILIDGPPGTGCSVIASVSGASAVVAVAEPTVSGEHDLLRVLDLAGHFGIPAFVCVNKWDICPAMAVRIEELAAAKGAVFLGRIRYDDGVTEAQKQAKTAVETGAACAVDIGDIWNKLQQRMEKENKR